MLGVNQSVIITERPHVGKALLKPWQAWRHNPGLQSLLVLLKTILFLKTCLGFDKKRDSEDRRSRIGRGVELRGDRAPFYVDEYSGVLTPGTPVSRNSPWD